jgi:hypothetical protein
MRWGMKKAKHCVEERKKNVNVWTYEIGGTGESRNGHNVDADDGRHRLYVVYGEKCDETAPAQNLSRNRPVKSTPASLLRTKSVMAPEAGKGLQENNRWCYRPND